LEIFDSREIGRYFSTWLGFPFLNTGRMLLVFQSSGTEQHRKERLNNKHKDGTIWCAVSFQILLGIPSCVHSRRIHIIYCKINIWKTIVINISCIKVIFC
jgi:hypothetical protein